MSTPQTYKGNGKHDWEPVQRSELFGTARLRVPGGWLYQTIVSHPDMENETLHVNTVFVPMPDVVGKAI